MVLAADRRRFLFFGGLLWATLWLALVALFALGGWGAFWLFVWWAVVPGLEYPSPISGKNGSRPEDGDYEDDPERGVYWGPKQPNGMMTRWSRPWFDWRSEQSFRATD